jgi:hypothetical protein
MADPPSDPDTPDGTRVGTPRWVKVFGIIAAVVVLLFVVLLVIGGGEHGPGRHTQLPGVTEHSARQPWP